MSDLSLSLSLSSSVIRRYLQIIQLAYIILRLLYPIFALAPPLLIKDRRNDYKLVIIQYHLFWIKRTNFLKFSNCTHAHKRRRHTHEDLKTSWGFIHRYDDIADLGNSLTSWPRPYDQQVVVKRRQRTNGLLHIASLIQVVHLRRHLLSWVQGWRTIHTCTPQCPHSKYTQ